MYKFEIKSKADIQMKGPFKIQRRKEILQKEDRYIAITSVKAPTPGNVSLKEQMRSLEASKQDPCTPNFTQPD